ncbi:MAG: ribosomal protein L16 [Phycisphaerae bacterium]
MLEAGWITARQRSKPVVSRRHFCIARARSTSGSSRINRSRPSRSETRMGKGKGEPEAWVACVRAGTMLYEIGGVEEGVARQALARISGKMPYRCRFVKRHTKSEACGKCFESVGWRVIRVARVMSVKRFVFGQMR